MAGIGIHDIIIKPLRKMITSVNKYLGSSVDILCRGYCCDVIAGEPWVHLALVILPSKRKQLYHIKCACVLKHRVTKNLFW